MSEGKDFGNFIDGEWTPSSTGAYSSDANPADEDDMIGEFPLSSAEDAAGAVGSAREEIFGPVLVIIKVDTFEEAIRVANDSEYSLAASLFSEGLEYIDAFQRELEAGMTHVNHGTVTDGCMPFGGVKNSGLGPFSKGVTNKDFYTDY
jgi:acyl-CoA reductase-like NAD-dependent aldehyde dehydrogenase